MSDRQVATGAIVDGVHLFPVRVYFEDTDTAGIVYHANYLKFMERARTEFLRLAGVQQSSSMASERFGYAVRSCRADFLAPAKLDDILEVRTTLQRVGAAYLDAQQDIWRGDTQIVAGEVRAVCLGPNGQPRRQPKDLVARISSLLPTPPAPER